MNIGIVGLGLIGASFAKEFGNINHAVYGIDKQSFVIDKAIADKVITDKLTIDWASKIDLLIVSVYTGATVEMIKEYLPYLKNGAIIMDTAGNKREICLAMDKLSKSYPQLFFMGGHPMAGREISGYDASKQGLFLGAKMLICNINSPTMIIETIERLLRDIGFISIVLTTPAVHDRNIAYTSQLAHILSNAYIKNKVAPCHKEFAAGSFRDLTRVAGMNVDMWSELMIENNDMLLEQLQEYIDSLDEIKQALKNKDRSRLKVILDKGNIVKKNLNL